MDKNEEPARGIYEKNWAILFGGGQKYRLSWGKKPNKESEEENCLGGEGLGAWFVIKE